jgi:hypothetical protein
MLMQRVARGMAALVDGCAWDGVEGLSCAQGACAEKPLALMVAPEAAWKQGRKRRMGASPAIEAQIPGLRCRRWWGIEDAKQILLLGVDWRWVQVMDRGVHG